MAGLRNAWLQGADSRANGIIADHTGLKTVHRTNIRIVVMIPDQTSRTAVYMAFYRALESARPAAKRLFCDPFARHFLRPFLLKTIGLSRVPLLGAILYWYADRRAPGARTSAIARTRLIDEAWCQALRDGIRQIDFGVTSYAFKRHVGSEMHQTFNYFQHRNAWVNAILKRISFLLEPGDSELR